MLKKKSIKKILISSLDLVLVSVLYLFPNSYKKNDIKEEVILNNITKIALYIPNKDNYVSRIMVISKEKDIIKRAKEIISYLTINSSYNDYLPEFVVPIIPNNTKLLSIDYNDELLKINFSKEFLNVKKESEKKLIESLIYSLTEIKGIKNIMIFIDGKHLDELPYSKEKLPLTLSRNIGINTMYELTSFKNTNLVTTYYLSKNNDYYYYIPISKLSNNNEEKIEVIINELKSAPINQTNLMSFLNSKAKLLDYEILENEISLSFNNYLLEDISKNKILEEVKYSIGLSIKDTYNIDKTIFKVNDVDIEFVIN
jgi:germination protein M